MAKVVLSLRIEDEAVQQLDAIGRRFNLNRSKLLERIVARFLDVTVQEVHDEYVREALSVEARDA